MRRTAAAACVLLLALAAAGSASASAGKPGGGRKLLAPADPAGLFDALGRAANVGKQAVKQAVNVVDTHLDGAADTLRKAGANLEKTANSFARADSKVLKKVSQAGEAQIKAGGKAVGAGLDAGLNVVADLLTKPFDGRAGKDVAEAVAKTKKAVQVGANGGKHVIEAIGDSIDDKKHAVVKGAKSTGHAAEKAAVRNVRAKSKGAARVGKAVDRLLSL